MSMIPTVGFALAGGAWLLVLMAVIVRRAGEGLGLSGAALLSALLAQIYWAAVQASAAWFELGPWPIAIAESLRPAMVSVAMLVLMQSSSQSATLRLATGIPLALALACTLLQGLELSSTLEQAFTLLAAVVALLSVEQVYRNTQDSQRWALKFLCLGLGVIFAFDVAVRADAFLKQGIDPSLSAARGYVNALAAPMAILGVTRLAPHRFRLSLSRDMAIHSASLVATGLFLLAMSVVAYGFSLLGSDWGSVLLWVLVFGTASGVLILLGSGSLRAKARVMVAKHFFSHRYDYRSEWFRITRMLSLHDSPVGGPELSTAQLPRQEELADRCLYALTRMVGGTAGRLWMSTPSGRWTIRASDGVAARQDLSAQDPVVEFLLKEDWIHDIDAWRDGRMPQACPPLPDWLKQDPKAWVLMPLRVQAKTVALLQVQRPQPPIPVDWEVRDLLRAAGQQVASMLEVEQTVEALVEARQFESFNRMSAFVVHDLKNLVAQLGLMLKNAERHRSDPEFQKDMLETVTNVLGRMQAMLMQLRSGVTPIEAPALIDLDRCLQAVIERGRWAEPRPRLEIIHSELDPSVRLIKVQAHAERLERVISHLVQNGVEASLGRAAVLVRRRIQGKDAVIEVIDQGMGMSEEFIEHQLFRPFRSTKPHGMGIGAFESREYLREIGARLDVLSTPGTGTTFTVHIPLSDAN